MRHPAAPVLATALAGMAWLAFAPPTADLAAHTFRALLWDAEGFTVWNNRWYGGHHVPGYSLLFPPLAGLVGTREAVVLAGVAASAVVATLCASAEKGHTPACTRRMVCGPDLQCRQVCGPYLQWVAVAGVVASLVVGRGPFLLGIAFGALALVVRERRSAAGVAGAACVLSSPVAGLFLLVAAVALPLRQAVAIGAPVVAAGSAVALLFPEGGEERFVATAFWPVLAATVAVGALVEGPARRAIAVYVAVLLFAFVVPEPVGQNASRLAVLAGPAVLLAFADRRRRAVLALCAALLYLQWLPAYRAISEAAGDPSTRAAFHAPLRDELLRRSRSGGDRVEVVFTRNHWEAVHVARRFPLARGWERQLDIERNRLFYEGELTPQRYERWLRAERIRFVALPDAPLDFSARAEAKLVERAPPFLREIWSSRDWRLFEVEGVAPAPHVVGFDRIVVDDPATILPYRHTRWWRVASGADCVSPTPDGRIRVQGAGVIEARLAGPRCRR